MIRITLLALGAMITGNAFAVHPAASDERQPHLLIGGHAFPERQAGPERAPTEQVAAWINIYRAKAVYPAQFHVDVFA